MRLVILAAILLLPAAAHANEVVQVIGYAVIIFGGPWAWVGYLLVIGSAVYGAEQARREARTQRDQQRAAYNAGLRDRTITRVATDAPHRFIYGQARVGSDIVAILNYGARDEYHYLVCIHAAHECEAIDEFYVAGKALGALDGNGDVTSGDYLTVGTERVRGESRSGTTFTLAHTPLPGTLKIYYIPQGGPIGTKTYVNFTLVGADVTVAESHSYFCSYNYTSYTPRVRVRKHLGGASDPADAELLALFPSKWEDTAVLRGYCYTVVRLDLRQPEFQTGIPALEALIRGAKLYDPRSTLTVYSSNPALAIYHYLTSDMCGVDAADIPLDDVITAANVCDETITIGGTSVARYTCNGTVTADQDPQRTLEQLAQCMAGGIVRTTWRMWAGKYIAAVMALDQSDVVGPFTTISGTPDADIYNGVRGQYIDPANTYVVTDFKPYQNTTYVTADGREQWQNIDFPFTDHIQRVHNLCRIFTEDQRNGFTFKGMFSLKTWSLRVGQRITFTSSFLGQTSKIYRVTDKRFGPMQGVELTLKEDAASIWDGADAVTVDSTPNTGLPNPFVVDKLASLTCSSGTDALLILADGSIVSRILVTWPQSTTSGVVNGGLIEIEWQHPDADVWQKISVTGAETQVYLSPVEDGEFYAVRARAVNPVLNAKSDWTYAEDHQVIGKTAPPPNITDLSIDGSVLNWTSVVALDLAGYVFRFHYGNNLDWGTAVPLHGGFITESPFDLVTRPSGVVTIMGKAIDTSGNESLATSNVFTDLGDAPIANVIEIIDFDPTYAGTLTGCTVVGGDVVAANLDSFYGTDAQSFYGLDAESFYEPSSFSAMTYATNDVAISSALAGSLMTMSMSMEGMDIIIEYRLADPAPFYGADIDSFYGADADPFYGAPTPWIPWPGQVVASNDTYNFRVSIGAGATQGKIKNLALTIDAPDIIEYLADLAIDAAGTTIPYTRPFASIKTVQATLQANGSGAETVEINKALPLAPSIKAYNSAHTAVSGATADITIKGY